MMSGITKNTKQEKAFRKMLKQAYMDYKDNQASHYRYGDRPIDNLLTLEEVAEQVFGWTPKQIEINENRWRKEWKREND